MGIACRRAAWHIDGSYVLRGSGKCAISMAGRGKSRNQKDKDHEKPRRFHENNYTPYPHPAAIDPDKRANKLGKKVHRVMGLR
jgi:hypothetical protein